MNQDQAFAVGDGATWTIATDRVACTVVEVSPSGHRVTVQRDKAVMVRGDMFGEYQEYEFEPDPDAERMVFTRRNVGNGEHVFKMVGTRTRSWGMRLSLDRREYRDPGF